MVYPLLWKVVPGAVKDVVEGHGENATVYSVDAVPPPDTANGSYVTDPSGALSRLARLYLNRTAAGSERPRGGAMAGHHGLLRLHPRA